MEKFENKFKIIIDIIDASFDIDKNLSLSDNRAVLNDFGKLKNMIDEHILFTTNKNIKKFKNLCIELYRVNDEILNHLQIEQQEEDKPSLNQNKNTLLFFYDPECIHSNKFLEIFNNNKTTKYNMLVVNCKNKKYESICKSLNIYEYPTVKLISQDKIVTYDGDSSSDSAFKLFINSNI